MGAEEGYRRRRRGAVRSGRPRRAGAVVPALDAYGGTLLETTLPDDAEARLQAALDAGEAG